MGLEPVTISIILDGLGCKWHICCPNNIFVLREGKILAHTTARDNSALPALQPEGTLLPLHQLHSYFCRVRKEVWIPTRMTVTTRSKEVLVCFQFLPSYFENNIIQVRQWCRRTASLAWWLLNQLQRFTVWPELLAEVACSPLALTLRLMVQNRSTCLVISPFPSSIRPLDQTNRGTLNTLMMKWWHQGRNIKSGTYFYKC